MNTDHTVRFGLSDSERLVLSNFEIDPDTYSSDAHVRAGNFSGFARIHGRISELEALLTSLQRMSQDLSGDIRFENMEGQLAFRCSVDNLGTVHLEVSIAYYGNRVECSFTTDPASLDLTIASLTTVIGRSRYEA